MYTVKHCMTVLKALFSNVSVSMGTVEKMEEYEKAVEAREDNEPCDTKLESGEGDGQESDG